MTFVARCAPDTTAGRTGRHWDAAPAAVRSAPTILEGVRRADALVAGCARAGGALSPVTPPTGAGHVLGAVPFRSAPVRVAERPGSGPRGRRLLEELRRAPAHCPGPPRAGAARAG